MDTILIDQDGNTLFQSINHSIPAVLNHPDNEYTHINEILNQNHPIITTTISIHMVLNIWLLEFGETNPFMEAS